MDQLKQIAWDLFDAKTFDSLAVAVIDYAQSSFSGFEFYQGQESKQFHFFDLASLTKPLTLSLCYLKDSAFFDRQMQLLLHHQGGLPSHGRLSRSTWREELLQWPVKDSPTEYSDYGALRLMLEYQQKTGRQLSRCLRDDWDSQVVFWQELQNPQLSPATGFREGKEIRGVVHDPNAYVIGEFCSHSGLFATLPGLCRTLLKMNTGHQMMAKVQEALQQSDRPGRFVLGFDRVQDLKTSLAGKGCSANTFGHLGFTGTSFWIDPLLARGHVILANATQNYWHERGPLNRLRRQIGEMVWAM